MKKRMACKTIAAGMAIMAMIMGIWAAPQRAGLAERGGEGAWTLAEVIAFHEKNPDAEWDWQLEVYGQTITPDITYLDLGEKIVKNYDELHLLLGLCPNLRQVDMFSTKIDPKNMDRLSMAFPDIHFGWSMKVGDHIVRTDATAFSTLHSDRSTQHTSKDFQVLKYCRNLYALDLGHNKIKDLSFLEKLTDLKILILACNQVEDITPLRNLKKLQYVELFMNRISDISPLAELGELMDLELTRNRIVDYTPLFGLKNLQRLKVFKSGKNVPVNDLSGALADTFIDFETNPTQGEWRKNKRYEDIKDIFSSGVYHDWTK